ncbi:hypothetical protein C8J57DRAFT_1722458 [Mycena rebaudengoi]|nr:hypothetical protein C8J57DRAFT_1722458 [Mycena rebaudengoi]
MQLGGIILPSELERAVFETAAFLDYNHIPRLLLVAHRVHTWLEPLLYHVLICGTFKPHRLQAILDRKSLESTDFVERHVRHLLFTGGFSSTEKTLSVCSGATDIAFFSYVGPAYLPHLERIRPTRLSINISQLFGGSPAFSSSMFSNITHLDISDGTIPKSAESLWNGVTSLPHLTHLSFNCSDRLPDGFLHMILDECKILDALIILVQVFEFTELEGATPHPPVFPIHDVRFVIACCIDFTEDWVAGAWGRDDFWLQADNFIRLKRSGDIPKERCCMTYIEFVNV